LERELGLLKYAPKTRGMAWFAWTFCVPAAERQAIVDWLTSYRAIVREFHTSDPISLSGRRSQLTSVANRIRELLTMHAPTSWRKQLKMGEAVEYLIAELFGQPLLSSTKTAPSRKAAATQAAGIPTISRFAAKWLHRLIEQMPAETGKLFKQSLSTQINSPEHLWQLGTSLVEQSTIHKASSAPEVPDNLMIACQHELVMVVISFYLCDWNHQQLFSKDVASSVKLHGMLGDHARISHGSLELDYHATVPRMHHYRRRIVPRFMAL
jgi:hypothetical protein